MAHVTRPLPTLGHTQHRAVAPNGFARFIEHLGLHTDRSCFQRAMRSSVRRLQRDL